MLTEQLTLFPAGASVAVVGAEDLVFRLDRVVTVGFPHVNGERVPVVETSWNARLRSTVGRVRHDREPVLVEVSPSYHEAHPDELDETLAHEFAHVLHPGAGHGRLWREELRAALQRLRVPVRQNLVRAAHPAPSSGRYLWLCRVCGCEVDVRPRRRADEVAVRTRCCRSSVDVIDLHDGARVPPRPFRVGCRRCRILYVAYDDAAPARRFAARHRCRCGSKLDVFTATPRGGTATTAPRGRSPSR